MALGCSPLLRSDLGDPGVPYDCHPERSEEPAVLTASIHCHPDCYKIVIPSEGAAKHPAPESKFLIKSGELLSRNASRAQPSQKFALIHPIFESLFAVDEHDWNFVRELTSQLLVRIDIHAAPGESAASVQLLQAFLDDVA